MNGDAVDTGLDPSDDVVDIPDEDGVDDCDSLS
jgi:hypothetical protein